MITYSGTKHNMRTTKRGQNVLNLWWNLGNGRECNLCELTITFI